MSKDCTNYKVIDDNDHTHCLPDPEKFLLGSVVECTEPRLINGKIGVCSERFTLRGKYTFFFGKLLSKYWSRDLDDLYGW